MIMAQVLRVDPVVEGVVPTCTACGEPAAVRHVAGFQEGGFDPYYEVSFGELGVVLCLRCFDDMREAADMLVPTPERPAPVVGVNIAYDQFTRKVEYHERITP